MNWILFNQRPKLIKQNNFILWYIIQKGVYISKLEKKVAHYTQEAQKLGLDLGDTLIAKVTKSLVPTI